MNPIQQPRKLDITKARAAGYRDEDIMSYAEKNNIQLYDSSEGLGSTPQEAMDRGHWTDWLPVAGAIAGSFVPGLGTIAGGAVGAGLGTVAKQFLDEKEGFDVGDVAKETALGAVGGVVGKGIGSIAGKGLSKAGQFIDDLPKVLKQGTRQIKVPASIYGAADEKVINATLDKYGFTGSAQRQYEMLKPTLKAIEGQIDDFVKANPGLQVKKETIKSSFFNNLKSNIRSRNLTQKQAIDEVNGYLNDLLKASGGKGKFTDISLEKLRHLKKLINEDMKSVQTAIDRGTALSPRQQVVLASWKSVDDAITEIAPQVKDLLRDESHLYAAAKSLSSARFNPPTFRIAGTSVPAWMTQAGRDIVGGGANLVNKGLGVVPPTLGGATAQTAGQTGVRLLVPEETTNETSQYNNNNNSNQSFHNQESIPQHTGLGNSPQDVTLTGYTPDVLYQGWIKAKQAGDSGSASMLRQMYEDEVDFQKNQVEKPKKKTEKQQTFISAAQAGQEALELLNTGTIASGPGQGFLGGLGEKIGTNSEAQQQYRSTIAIARTAARNAMLGANMTPKEMESISAFIPEFNDHPSVARTKLKTFVRLMNQFGQNLEGTATTYGLPSSPSDVSFSSGLGSVPTL